MTPKGKSAVIGLDDVKEFLKTEADFTFEMRTLHRLRSIGFDCQHGGSYIDPNTSRMRQFDIRARRVEEGYLALWCAVEAKNLRVTSPLLIHMVKRTDKEAFHDVIIRVPVTHVPRRVRISSYDSAYRPDEFVGKRHDQVGSKGSDSDVYQRFNQAMNSARNLIEEAAAGPHSLGAFAIVPVVVVPEKRLWQVKYDEDGSQIGEPEQVDYCPYFINLAWDVGSPAAPMTPYVMSHLEVVTLSGLKQRMDGQFFQRGGVFAGGTALLNR
jgi:hypothetical protein